MYYDKLKLSSHQEVALRHIQKKMGKDTNLYQNDGKFKQETTK